MSPSCPKVEVEPIPLPGDARDWSELPLDALSVIFAKLGAIEILMGAGLVCYSWLEAAKVPELWRFVDMTRHKLIFKKDNRVMCAMAKVAVDRSAGKLESFWGQKFVTCNLLSYIGERTSSLKSIRLIGCTSVFCEELSVFAAKFPLLEELEHSYAFGILEEFYKYVGSKCPQLRCLRVNAEFDGVHQVIHDDSEDEEEEEEEEEDGVDELFNDPFCEEEDVMWHESKNADAFAIAENMHELRILQISGNSLTKKGVHDILKNCPHLELLDLSDCWNVKVDDGLRARWAHLKHVKITEGQTPFQELHLIDEHEGRELVAYEDLPHGDDEMGDEWDNYYDDISLLSDGSEPDLSNIDIDDITAYTYIHDYYGL
ncbi:putative F-box/LRR-repeat protein 9 [Lolium perenne]|uniref:putative F-box/LRR-repeat protein 9 n=1 Tax=Lolium perenne TaxID=4522 RepID=UPI0021EB1AD5|nr:F-box protein SKIP19-like [Lolium perenne]